MISGLRTWKGARLNKLRLEECNSTALDNYIIEYHYLHSAPAGARLRLWIKDDRGYVIGAMMWGRPTARTYDHIRILELTRFFMIDDTEPFAESKALAMARKLIRKRLTKVKGLLTYTSIGENHKGTIFEADGWFSIGVTEAKAWNKKGRANIDVSKKIRWVRSV
jgi:hypothetical protein